MPEQRFSRQRERIYRGPGQRRASHGGNGVSAAQTGAAPSEPGNGISQSPPNGRRRAADGDPGGRWSALTAAQRPHTHLRCLRCGGVFDWRRFPMTGRWMIWRPGRESVFWGMHCFLQESVPLARTRRTSRRQINHYERGTNMELKGSKTEANLWKAFAGESQARNKYDYFASQAKKDGYEQIAAIFQETALNERSTQSCGSRPLSGIGSTEEEPGGLLPVRTRSGPRCTPRWPVPPRGRGLFGSGGPVRGRGQDRKRPMRSGI